MASLPTVTNWTIKYQGTGSFRDTDNRSDEENELIKLRKENKQFHGLLFLDKERELKNSYKAYNC